MQPARIAELLAPFLASDQRLTANDLDCISTYIDILHRWNARVNLTAIRDPDEIVTRHFGESLFAARHLFHRTNHVGTAALGRPAERNLPAPQFGPASDSYDGLRTADGVRPTTDAGSHRGRAAFPGRVDGPNEARALAPEANNQRPIINNRVTVADLGSGAGFPGAPIKLWAPHISVTLIESNQKKVAFLREIARALILTDINILHARAESLPAATYNVVTLRAVERFESILPFAERLLAPFGRLVLLIGAPQADPTRSILPHLTWASPIPIPSSRTRILMTAYKSSTASAANQEST